MVSVSMIMSCQVLLDLGLDRFDEILLGVVSVDMAVFGLARRNRDRRLRVGWV
jgi:hypothetical protein